MSGNTQVESVHTTYTPQQFEKIRTLNDRFRKTGTGGVTTMTTGIHALGNKEVMEIRKAIANFTGFSKEADPHGEHDFGNITHKGRMIYWRIEYYDEELMYDSPDPTDALVTRRLMTILLANEY